LCEHNHRKERCIPCGGSGICEHNRQRSKCKLCGGSGICEHKRVRSPPKKQVQTLRWVGNLRA
jgi:DnaJ-class molecular chaperone